MDELRARFSSLDRVRVPNLWDRIEVRATALGSMQRVTSAVVLVPKRRASDGNRLLALLPVAALLVALLAAAIALGTGLIKLPAIVPVPAASPSTSASAPPTDSASITPAPSRVAGDGRAAWIVFYAGDGPNLWAMRSDGSGARMLLGTAPAVAWTHDGGRLLVNDGHIRVADVADDIGPLVDTGVAVPQGRQWEAFDFAPDGERVVYVDKSKCAPPGSGTASEPTRVVLVSFGGQTADAPGANCHVLSILDLRTRQRTELGMTLANDTIGSPPGSLELPAWSPDGTRIAYTRLDQSLRTGGRRDLWIVNVDGSNPSRVELSADVAVQEPRWSPDGTRIVFASEAAGQWAVFVVELATGRLERVATGSSPADRNRCCAEWIDDTHLRVEGVNDLTSRFWLVKLGTNPPESRFLVDLTDWLTPTGGLRGRSAPGDPGRTFFWQPVEGRQP